MSKEEKHKVLWDLETAQMEMECICSDDHFKEGFKLGLLLAVQSFLD